MRHFAQVIGGGRMDRIAAIAIAIAIAVLLKE
jgi:hypothetical protein